MRSENAVGRIPVDVGPVLTGWYGQDVPAAIGLVGIAGIIHSGVGGFVVVERIRAYSTAGKIYGRMARTPIGAGLPAAYYTSNKSVLRTDIADAAPLAFTRAFGIMAGQRETDLVGGSVAAAADASSMLMFNNGQVVDFETAIRLSPNDRIEVWSSQVNLALSTLFLVREIP